jgi:competence ComEA-like helix-hairpin-helix protein
VRAPESQYSSVPTANEKKALWFLAIVALSGSAVRLWRANAPHASVSEVTALERQIQRVDSVRAMRHKRTAKAQLRIAAEAPLEKADARPLDLDRATAEEIEALPGVGPALAKRIVASRDSVGSFGKIETLCDVRGIGPVLVEKLRPLVTFSGAHRPLSAGCGDAPKRTRKTRASSTRQPR